MTVCIDQPVLNGVISACFAVSLLLLLASTGTLMCSLDVRLLAGLVLAAAICCLQMLPNIVCMCRTVILCNGVLHDTSLDGARWHSRRGPCIDPS